MRHYRNVFVVMKLLMNKYAVVVIVLKLSLIPNSSLKQLSQNSNVYWKGITPANGC